MIVKPSPYNGPFIPRSESGVYWLGLEHQGTCLHDGHVQAFRAREVSQAPAVAVSSILADCGLAHLAAPSVQPRRADVLPAHLEALSAISIKAARRRLGGRAGEGRL